MTAPRGRLRQLLAAPAILVAPGVPDGTAARIAEKLGFQALYVREFETSASVLGQPAAGYLTIKAAVDAPSDPDFVIIARTDARTSMGLDEALSRGAAHHDAGTGRVEEMGAAAKGMHHYLQSLASTGDT
ncbi:MAG: hypothetical protein PHQ28_17690, partial [Mycobacterium sp.]|nr:hypothetical protein [Mycobacterium sp.]